MSDAPLRQTIRRMGRLVRKEVSTILRDRRTVITLVLMPLLLYPLLSIAFRQFLLAGQLDQEQARQLVIAILPGEDEKVIKGHLAAGQRVMESLPQLPDTVEQKTPPPRLMSLESGDPRADVLAGRADLGLRLRRAQPAINRGVELALDCEAYYLDGSARGLETLERVQILLEAAHRQKLFHRRLPSQEPAPVAVVRLLPGALRDPAPKSALSLAALIPLVLILMTITGAVYPAIDLTAGEPERGTLEILVAAPVPRLGLLFAKYVSVVTVAVLTALVNLATMTLTLSLSGLGTALFHGQGLTVLAVVQVFFLLLLFAAFFSAVLLAVTSFARSFKEAQAYLIPLMLVSLTPGVASLLPGLKLDAGMALVPLLNIVLLSRDVLLREGSAGTAAIVVAATLVYALGAVALAARIFGAEAVLYSEQTGWGDLFRRPRQPRPVPTLGAAMMCLALLFPASYVAVNLLARGTLAPVAEEMAWKTTANLLLFGGLPLLFLWMGRVQLLSGFRLENPGLAFWGPAVLLGLGLWPFADVLQAVLRELHLATLDPEKLAGVSGRFRYWRAEAPLLVVVSLAVVPALIEELFFRGFLFGTLLRASGRRAAIFGSALLFGSFHLVDQGLIVFERGVSSTVLGLVLAWVCWRSGSVVPGMLLHAAYNSSLILLALYEPDLVARGWLKADQASVLELWLVIGGALSAGAAGWLFLLRRAGSVRTPLATSFRAVQPQLSDARRSTLIASAPRPATLRPRPPTALRPKGPSRGWTSWQQAGRSASPSRPRSTRRGRPTTPGGLR